MAIKIDYSVLDDTARYMRELAGSFGQLKNYGQELNSSLNPSLREWALDAQEPYGHSHVEDARTKITEKKAELDEESDSWADYAKKIDTFSEFAQNKDKEAAECFSALAVQYTNYKGLKGVFQFLGDTAYNLFAVEFANSNDFTRNIAGWLKEKKDDLDICWQQTKDYWQHGNGVYILNKIKQGIKVGLAVVGVVAAIVATPFTGGLSAVTVVGCLGILASSIGAYCTIKDASIVIKENNKVLDRINKEGNESNPGLARFYGDTSGYSSYVKKNDFGEEAENNEKKRDAKHFDELHSGADAVSAITTGALTFGTATTSYGKTVFDFSKSNIMSNISKSLGIGVLKENNSTSMIEKQIDVIQDGVQIKASSSIIGMENTVEKIGDFNKATLSIQKLAVGSEYTSLVATDGVNIAKYSKYASTISNASTSYDITSLSVKAGIMGKGFKTVDSIKTLQQDVSSACKIATFTMNVGDTAIGVAQTGELDGVVNRAWKTTKIGGTLDKYLISYDDSKNKMGVGSVEKKAWKFITAFFE